MNSFSALVEEGELFVVEVEVDDLFDAVAAEDTGHTDAEILLAIFSFEKSGAGDETLLVAEHGSHTLGSSSAGGLSEGAQ